MTVITEKITHEPEELICRFCGADSADTFFFGPDGDFIGCEYCVCRKPWYDTQPGELM